MKKKTFVYTWLGFNEAGETMEEAMRRIHEEEVKQEIEDKKMLSSLKKANLG